MSQWFEREIAEHGHVPLFFFLVAFVVTFLFIRASTRMIRAGVKWWPGNITPGGQHIHHAVFGVIAMIVSGGALITVVESAGRTTITILAALFGVGAALVLDEFALIFYLRDVYWSDQGRASVDAVFVAVGITGLVLTGVRPLSLFEAGEMTEEAHLGIRLGLTVLSVVNLLLAAVVLLKGKLWTGLCGLVVPVLLFVGAVRLARPASPWARWFYHARPERMCTAVEREKRWRRPVVQARIYLQDLVAGRPDPERARRVAGETVERTVRPAPAPISPATTSSGTMDGLPGPGDTT
ncbi:hypothetical protein [Rhodococcus sp. HNM0569]|uniref:hypothetical protein n=1 Tax=Rhodococcus sp. HNM0569 TaxID=2716340 RepID=UPI00146BDF83|nr:hypothetical protein [Rhodococcus sp. HNM0569]NLU81536.1 hypothetical protein [Rhodococcus sp. HNM0569]